MINLSILSKVTPKLTKTAVQLVNVMNLSNTRPSSPERRFGCLCSRAALVWCTQDQPYGRSCVRRGCNEPLQPLACELLFGSGTRPRSLPEPATACPGPLQTRVHRLGFQSALGSASSPGICWRPGFFAYPSDSPRPYPAPLACLLWDKMRWVGPRPASRHPLCPGPDLAKLLTLLGPGQCRSGTLSQQDTSSNCCV